MTTLEKKYQQFLDEIDWDEFEPIEKSYFFEELGPEPGEPGAVLHILQSKTRPDYIIIKHINTGAKLEIPRDNWTEFRDWIENNYADGEDGAAYYAYVDAMDKEDTRDAREYNREEDVLTMLKKHCSPYRISQSPILDETNRLFYPDFIIYDEKREIQFVIEVTIANITDLEKAIDRKFGHLYNKYPEATFVLTNGKKAVVHEPEKTYTEDFQSLLAQLLPSTTSLESITDGEIQSFFLSAVDELVHKSKTDEKRKKKKELIKFFNTLKKEDIILDEIDPSIFYLAHKKEKELIQILLGKYNKETIVKFSSARSLYALLENGTIGMCSLVCMNDSSESDYADKKVNAIKTIDDVSDSFIISSCDDKRIKDLTMWRLYADDAKGIGIKYKINKRKIRNDFYLAPISYEDQNGYHWELEIIKALLHSIPLKGCRFVLKDWLVWKHFFKNHSYAVEEEIRLLYQPKKKAKEGENIWIVDDRTSIYSEMRLFDLRKKKSVCPLELKQIVLGTRFPEPITNMKQIKKKIEVMEITTSTKTDDLVEYRKFDYR